MSPFCVREGLAHVIFQELHLPPPVFGQYSGTYWSSRNAFRRGGYVRRVRGDCERLSQRRDSFDAHLSKHIDSPIPSRAWHPCPCWDQRKCLRNSGRIRISCTHHSPAPCPSKPDHILLQIVAMATLAVTGIVYWATHDPHSTILKQNWALRPGTAIETARAIFYGVCVAFLGVTGMHLCWPVEIYRPGYNI